MQQVQYVEEPYVQQPMMQYVEQPYMEQPYMEQPYMEQPMMQYVEQPMMQPVYQVARVRHCLLAARAKERKYLAVSQTRVSLRLPIVVAANGTNLGPSQY
jgi:hypothetical protein